MTYALIFAVAVLSGGETSEQSRTPIADAMIRQTFPGLSAKSFKLIFEGDDKRLVMAANEYEILPDGRLKLVDCVIIRTTSDPAIAPIAVRAPFATVAFETPIGADKPAMKYFINNNPRSATFPDGMRMTFDK